MFIVTEYAALMCLIYLHSVGLFLPLYSINEMVKTTLNVYMYSIYTALLCTCHSVV